ncbi:hypothetical protein ACFVWP_26915 [Streptomyces sp. NPDC058175]|uniref:hypothetical protein n=1 Tax=unclassified Streptomyces TaxID=2593676 RepID=UPI0036E79073
MDRLTFVGAMIQTGTESRASPVPDPHELVNLAVGRGRRNEIRDRFTLMRSVEKTDLAPLKTTGP